MRVWVTRARPGAEATAARLQALGHAPLVDPVLEVRPLPLRLDLTGVDALAFTSANGVRAYATLGGPTDRPAFAVGPATAEAARAAGFGEVAAAEGDVASLGRLIARARPACVLHLGPAEPAGDLVGDLARAGVKARAAALYETLPLRPEAALAAAAAGELEAVLVHSPKAARVLADLGLPPGRRPAAFAISSAAAAPLRAAGWTLALAAGRPDEAALLGLLPPAG